MVESSAPEGVGAQRSGEDGSAGEYCPADLDLLRRVVEIAQAHLAEDKPAQDFLRGSGITDTEIWRRFRVGSAAL